MKRLGLRLHADEEHWIPLSDLMTGLMFLFLLISAFYMLQVEQQRDKPQSVLKAYAQTRIDISNDLDRSFAKDLAKWGATYDPKTLSVRFNTQNVLFAPGSSELQPRFKTILADFFPRYLAVIDQPQYRDVISELRVEGYTSTFWRPGASVDEAYIGNMALSQDRARAVVAYVLTLPAAQQQKGWLMQVLSANGLSSAHTIRTKSGAEDVNASQRVEFGVRTNADAALRRMLAIEATPAPVTQATAVGPEVPTVTDSMPDFPVWSNGTIGKPLSSVFSNRTSKCLGYLDGTLVRYAGARTGDQIYGWAFDTTASAPVERVVAVDAKGIIVGAGSGGFERPDVPASVPSVTSTRTGWQGYVKITPTPIVAWAVMKAPGTVCPLQAAHAGSSQAM